MWKRGSSNGLYKLDTLLEKRVDTRATPLVDKISPNQNELEIIIPLTVDAKHSLPDHLTSDASSSQSRREIISLNHIVRSKIDHNLPWKG